MIHLKLRLQRSGVRPGEHPLSYATLSLPPSLLRYTVCVCVCVCVCAVAREDTLQKVREVVRPFDWTYTTDYSGTLLPVKQAQLQVLA